MRTGSPRPPTGLRDLIPETVKERQAGFETQVARLWDKYAEMSDIYQKKKEEGTGADVPLQ